MVWAWARRVGPDQEEEEGGKVNRMGEVDGDNKGVGEPQHNNGCYIVPYPSGRSVG